MEDGPLGRDRFERETGIREGDWSGRYWARWNDAVKEAGLAPNQMNALIDDEVVIAISTDDAYGIEGYWHRRFAAQRRMV